MSLLALVIVWSLLAMALAQFVLVRTSGVLDFAYYVMAGLGWVPFAMMVVSWMSRGEQPRPADGITTAGRADLLGAIGRQHADRHREQRQRAGEAEPCLGPRRIEVFPLDARAVGELAPPVLHRHAGHRHAVVEQEFRQVREPERSRHPAQQLVILRGRIVVGIEPDLAQRAGPHHPGRVHDAAVEEQGLADFAGVAGRPEVVDDLVAVVSSKKRAHAPDQRDVGMRLRERPPALRGARDG